MNANRCIRYLLYFPLLLGLLAGCDKPHQDLNITTLPETTAMQTEQAETFPLDPTVPEPSAETVLTAEDRLMKMSLREKVGQLFIITPDPLDPSQAEGATVVTDSMTQMLQEYPVGGIVMFSKNITSPDQITAFNAGLQKASRIPLFLSIDEEGGIVARLARHKAFDLPKYKSAGAVGSSANPADALEMGNTIGGYLKTFGFNMDFAPVADVNTNPSNPVIGTRAFSSDPSTAAALSRAMADGLSQQGIIPVLKHFPGHGDTAEDSHSGIAIIRKTKGELEACEWIPFQNATDRDCIMVGHIAVPSINGNLIPATVSKTIVTDILKKQLDFNGLVITDSLSMGAITNTYSSGEVAVSALQAGCHIILMPVNFQEAFEAVVCAVEEGILSETQLNDTVRHILQFKLDHHIMS